MLHANDPDFEPKIPSSDPFRADANGARSVVLSRLVVEPTPLMKAGITHALYLRTDSVEGFSVTSRREMFRMSEMTARLLCGPGSGITLLDRDGNPQEVRDPSNVLFFEDVGGRISVWVERRKVATVRGESASVLARFLGIDLKNS